MAEIKGSNGRKIRLTTQRRRRFISIRQTERSNLKLAKLKALYSGSNFVTVV